MNKKNAGVEAVDKALQILNTFSEKREELTLTEIAKQIEKYNRSGIPLYVYWNKTLDEPIVLNEILTEGYLMEVIDEN